MKALHHPAWMISFSVILLASCNRHAEPPSDKASATITKTGDKDRLAAKKESPMDVSKSTEAPYGIDKRPMPPSNELDRLLPLQIGVFARDPVRPPPNIHTDPIYATYRSGGSEVFVELGICADSSAARKALSRAKSETDREFPGTPQLFVGSKDPSYLKTTNKLGAFMAWTRGAYYFSAHAKGGEADLDAFMKAFPY